MDYRMKLVGLLVVLMGLSGCVGKNADPNPGTPPISNYNFSATPNTDYIYRSPPPAVIQSAPRVHVGR